MERKGKAMTKGKCAANRLATMLRRLNRDIRHNFDLTVAIVADAARQCGNCANVGDCDNWFDGGAPAE